MVTSIDLELRFPSASLCLYLTVALCLRLDTLSQAATAGQDVELRMLNSTQGFKMFGATANDETGKIVQSAGDVNGDGIDDILVGSVNFGLNSGVVYVIFGHSYTEGAMPDVDFGSFQTSTVNGFRIIGDEDGITSWCGLGDVNGDNIGDIMIGSENVDLAYVIFGCNTTTTGSVVLDLSLGTFVASAQLGFCLYGPGGSIGRTVGGPGDVNGDGINDMLVSAPMRSLPETGFVEAGMVYVIFGRNVASGTGVTPFANIMLTSLETTTVDGFVIFGAAQGNNLGSVVTVPET